jgi:glycosyltransferase involved in cell wall biosynthesis
MSYSSPLLIDTSVVIPTRNRFQHLTATVKSIEAQTYQPKEIIIVDSSDNINYGKQNLQSTIPLQWIFSKPSVCLQRNLGIRAATSDWIFLCDDDLELEKQYMEKLVNHVRTDKSSGAVAGLFLQREKNEWVKNYPMKSFGGLLWKYIFQHGIWGNIDSVKPPLFLKPLHGVINSFYKQRANSQSLAGWPLVTQWSGDVIQTKFYSIGANSLVRKDWLLQSPFNERLDAHGIGDNYGVALGFPLENSIHVLTNAFAYHHHANENRQNENQVKYLRVLALDYFLKKGKVNLATRLFFIWSIFGHCLYSLIRQRKHLGHLCRSFVLVVLNRNPLLIEDR